MKLKLNLLAIAFIISMTPLETVAADLQVHMTGLRNTKGQILVGLFNDEDKFPNKEAEFRGIIVKSTDKKASVVFKDVPEGVYAVAIIHDENMDGKSKFLGYKLISWWFGLTTEENENSLSS